MKLSYNINTTFAILIGIGEYESNDFIPIKPVYNNLQSLKSILTDKDICGLDIKNVEVIENETHLEILKKIKKILNGQTPIETIFIYYVGHGYRTERDKLFLTATNSNNDFDLIRSSSIEFTLLKNLIEKSPHKPNCLLIIDACYSGIATMDSNSLTEDEKSIKGTYIITSSSHKEQSFFDPIAEHTFFTGDFIEILKNGDEKFGMYMSINNVYSNLQSKFRSKNIGEPQKKDNLDVGDFYFAINKKHNKQFILLKAEGYFLSNSYDKALELYIHAGKFFDDENIKSKIEICEREIRFSKLVTQGDYEFYSKKNYEAALKKYNEAVNIHPEHSIVRKINQAEEYIRIKNEINSHGSFFNFFLTKNFLIYLGFIVIVFLLYIKLVPIINPNDTKIEDEKSDSKILSQDKSSLGVPFITAELNSYLTDLYAKKTPNNLFVKYDKEGIFGIGDTLVSAKYNPFTSQYIENKDFEIKLKNVSLDDTQGSKYYYRLSLEDITYNIIASLKATVVQDKILINQIKYVRIEPKTETIVTKPNKYKNNSNNYNNSKVIEEKYPYGIAIPLK